MWLCSTWLTSPHNIRAVEVRRDWSPLSRMGGVAIAFFLVLLLAAVALCEERPSKSMSQLRTDYQEAVSKLESLFSSVNGSATLTQEKSAGTPEHTIHTTVYDFARKPGLFKLSMRRRTGATKSRTEGGTMQTKALPLIVRGFNKATSFELTKKNESSSYAITATGGTSPKEQRLIEGSVSGFLGCAYSIERSSMSALLADPNFVLNKAEDVDFNGKWLVKIHFASKPAKSPGTPEKPVRYIHDGWVLVSPKENLVMYQYEVNYESMPQRELASSSVCSIEYEGSYMGTPIPKRVLTKNIVRVHNPKGEVTTKRGRVYRDGYASSTDNMEFDEFNFGEVPDREFALSAFGLPDVGEPRSGRRGTGGTFWIFLLALGALLASVALKYLSFRNRRAQARPEV